MSIGVGSFLLVLGGILILGVADRIAGVHLHAIGVIWLAGGGVALLLSAALSRSGRARPAPPMTTGPASVVPPNVHPPNHRWRRHHDVT